MKIKVSSFPLWVALDLFLLMPLNMKGPCIFQEDIGLVSLGDPSKRSFGSLELSGLAEVSVLRPCNIEDIQPQALLLLALLRT